MAGFLGESWEDPKSQAIMALAGGLLRKDFGGGLLGANQAFADAKSNAMKQRYMDMQMQGMQAELEQKRSAQERQQRIQAGIPGLFKAPGMTGGEAVPQTMGGMPMFSQPMGVSPMQATPGGFDVQGALRLGLDEDRIAKLAGLQDIGRPKATRQMEVDDGKGGKRIALVDDFGREVAGFAGYTAPVQVNQGDRVSFVKPAPGVSMPVGMSPDAKASNALGWANHGLSRQRLSMERETAGAGRAPQGYRFKADGSLEAIPGGPADKQAAATTDERKAATLLQRLEGSQQQLTGALQSKPGAAKPEMLGASLRAVGMPDAANVVTSEKRQQVEAAQMDILDAALTLGTGAAYTREQLEGYRRSYFPQIGDSPATVKDKQDRLENVIRAARIAAGRAGNAIPAKGGATGSWGDPKTDAGNDPLGLRK